MQFVVMYSPKGGETKYEDVINNGGGEVPGRTLYDLSGEARSNAQAWQREDDGYTFLVIPIAETTHRVSIPAPFPVSSFMRVKNG